MNENDQKYTSSNISVDAMKEQARKSGLSYNEAIEFIAKTTGGRDTHIYSDTNIETVKEQNRQSESAKRK